MSDRSVTAMQALDRLRSGNARFVDGDRCIDTYLGHTNLDEHLAGQAPYAILLGCSDSRVPVEIIFDAGLGELFVTRVAGNIVVPALIGSIELAAVNFGPRLVVVLGHTGCGAVDLTLSTLENDSAAAAGHVNSIVKHIRPAIAPVVAGAGDVDRSVLMEKSVHANVRAGVEALRHGSDILERLIRDDGLLVVGAEYSMATGVVRFIEGVPGS